MNLLNPVTFGPDDVRAAMTGQGERRVIMAIATSTTCGEMCWHAREEICRCSCGGRNHGCLSHGGERPERTAKINGERYRLKAVGRYADIYADARAINRAAGYRSVNYPTLVIGGACQGRVTPEKLAAAKASGERFWFSQYKYTWSETDEGAPARLKAASANQLKWPELSGWPDGAYILWERTEMPERCGELVIDDATGEPLADQLPK